MNRRTLFYAGIAGWVLFEAANVYFIMPMPGSQRMESLGLAYFLYRWRWVFRGIFAVSVAAGFMPAFRASRWPALLAVGVLAVAAYMFNLEMAADRMFRQPGRVVMATAADNKVGADKLVMGLELNGRARAYPIQYMGYHHQFRDTVGGEPVMVTYCTVCRTGRVFSPKVEGRPEVFRLVGMDHFNAMFEDATTGSWWRQATGEAVAGPMKGALLPEFHVTQTSLRTWLGLYPGSLVMQADSTFSEEYADMDSYDLGLNRGKLTTTDTVSWNDKSWVVGIEADRNTCKAYDWNRLKKERIINDQMGDRPLVLVLATDDKSFFAFERPDAEAVFSVKNDSLHCGGKTWDLSGRPAGPGSLPLKRITARQEFWHSWSTFHPYTTRY